MGVTDLRPYFMQIIGHNSMNFHRIPTKRGTEIRLNEPFKCAKFQPDPSTHSCFIADFAKCAKRRRKKRRKKTQTLAANRLWESIIDCGNRNGRLTDIRNGCNGCGNRLWES